MLLPDLLESLNTLEDKVPTILGCRNQGVQLRLSPDGSGCIEAELKPGGQPAEAFRTKSLSNGRYFACGDFESLDALYTMLMEPERIEWFPKQ